MTIHTQSNLTYMLNNLCRVIHVIKVVFVSSHSNTIIKWIIFELNKFSLFHTSTQHNPLSPITDRRQRFLVNNSPFGFILFLS